MTNLIKKAANERIAMQRTMKRTKASSQEVLNLALQDSEHFASKIYQKELEGLERC